MNYLSPQIQALAEKKSNKKAPLVKKGYSCGIFQDYGFNTIHKTQNKS